MAQPSTLSPLHTAAIKTASPFTASPLKRKTMSITQTYFLAHQARSKLSSEASRPDHNLRLLVGHANLLDSLMLELADAEREQESWFNNSVRSASTKSQERHIQWADAPIVEETEDWDADDAASDSSDDMYDEDVEMADAISLTRVQSHMSQSPPTSPEDEDFDDEEDYAKLALHRSPSHQAPSSPPELVEHDADSSEDESMPPSPPTTLLPSFSEKQQEAIVTEKSFYEDGFYLPPRNPARLVTAVSVY